MVQLSTPWGDPYPGNGPPVRRILSNYFDLLLMVTDDGPVRPAAEVAEAEGAKYIGLVILVATCLPFGVVISLDVWRFIKWMQHRNKPHHPPRQTARC